MIGVDEAWTSIAVVGGAGFIGSHVVDRLVAEPTVERITVFDNFTSGRWWHLEEHRADARLHVVEADAKDLEALTACLDGHDVVVHLASNPDIAAAMASPTIDFDEGTLLTNHVAEAVRRTGVQRVVYASGSGVYGDLGEVAPTEDHGPMAPTSTYGASKLAGEALLGAYAHMFGTQVSAFRFGNVVGPRQTHGVGFDFLRRLRADPSHLSILGDGKQSKSYIHVHDVLDAVFLAASVQHEPFSAYNVATGDYITVTEIADLAVEVMGLDPSDVRFDYSGGSRGWTGDVPIVRLDTSKICSLGWRCARPTHQALCEAMTSMLAEGERLGW